MNFHFIAWNKYLIQIFLVNWSNQIELNRLKRRASPIRTNPQITEMIRFISVPDTPSEST